MFKKIFFPLVTFFLVAIQSIAMDDEDPMHSSAVSMHYSSEPVVAHLGISYSSEPYSSLEHNYGSEPHFSGTHGYGSEPYSSLRHNYGSEPHFSGTHGYGSEPHTFLGHTYGSEF